MHVQFARTVAASAVIAAAAAGEASAVVTRDQAVAIFRDAASIYTLVCAADPYDDPIDTPPTLERRAGEALETAATVLSKRKDLELANALVHYTVANDCAQDDAPALTLGTVFRTNPAPLTMVVAKLPDPERCQAIAQLTWGWRNETKDAKLTAKRRADRERRLKSLQATVAETCWESK